MRTNLPNLVDSSSSSSSSSSCSSSSSSSSPSSANSNSNSVDITSTTATTNTMSSRPDKMVFLSVSAPVREVSSAPHSRTCSLKKNKNTTNHNNNNNNNISGVSGRQHQHPRLPYNNSNSGSSCNSHFAAGLGLEPWDLRPRTNSLPSRPEGEGTRHRHASDPDPTGHPQGCSSRERLCRVRSFKLTSKGLVKHGDSFKRRSTHSLMSTGSTATTGSTNTSTTDPNNSTNTTTSNTSSSSSTSSSMSGPGVPGFPGHLGRPRTLSLASEESTGMISGSGGSFCAPSYFRVALMGAPGVGKSALIRQFMSSEYRGTFDIVTPDAEDPETTVSVMLDGEESMIEFIDQPQEDELDELRADAFVVVFSLADQESFTCAVRMVRHLRVDLGLDRAILLVANKVDLARQRRVHLSDARLVAVTYDCGLVEGTSAALNHQVDELLVTILTHIRLRLEPPPPLPSHLLLHHPSSSSHSSSSSTSSSSSSNLLFLLPSSDPSVHCSGGGKRSPRSRSPAARGARAMSFLTKLFNMQSRKKSRSCDNLLIQ